MGSCEKLNAFTIDASQAILGLCSLVSAILGVGTAARAQRPTAAATALFETRIRPVLHDQCIDCHGPTRQAGGVRLDSREAILKDAAAQKIVAPGDPENSALINAVNYRGKIQMPPAGKLNAATIAMLTEWVRSGAVWPQAQQASAPGKSTFWSFQPITTPRPPRVKNSSWVQTPIDSFVLAGLEAKGLKPAAPADRRTLLRRATYDLTGLPPSAAEIQAFLADRRSGAFARVIDRLLASPAYGERWGRHWLDVARYADSADARGLGSEGDISEAWRYRDWVVNSLNADMGYDRFVMNQVAGDLLPSEQEPGSPLNVPGTIATGMLAIGNWGNGDADKEKLVTDIADDQVDVISRGFMGITMACARCHDHKFDPLTQKDYYGLAGIFFSSHILPRLTPKGQGEVMLRVSLETPGLKARREKAEAAAKSAEDHLAAVQNSAFQAFADSLKPKTAAYAKAALELALGKAKIDPDAFATEHGLYPSVFRKWRDTLRGGAYPLLTGAIKDTGNPGVFSWRGKPDCPNMLINTNSKPLTISTITMPARSVAVHPGPANGVALEWVSPINGTVQLTGSVADADPNGGDGIAWAIDDQTAAGTQELSSGEFPNGGAQDFSKGNGANRLNSIKVASGDHLQLVVLPKKDYSFDTTVVRLIIHTDGAGKTTDWDLSREMMTDPLRSNPRADSYGNPDVWRFADMADIRREARMQGPDGQALTEFVRSASVPGADIDAAARIFQQRFKGAHAGSPDWLDNKEITLLPASAKNEIAKAEADLDAAKKAVPPAPGIANAIQEGGIPGSPTEGIHDVHVHIRGRYDRLGDLVPRRFPVIIAGDRQPNIGANESGRLQLAKWLVNPDHPLTSRVIVNRTWQHHFGEGIVRTPSNFGKLGERPTDPALLDWLASVFKQRPGSAGASAWACGWSFKKLHRLIMLSRVYQQASEGDPLTVKVDPDNRFWGHYNRQRLEAEAVRDTLLAVSGELDRTVGGMANRDFNVPRRTLYIMTIRSDRSGYGPLFDTADPTSSIDKRAVSTVAPQALFLMNNAFVIQRAQVLAGLALKSGGPLNSDRVGWLYHRLFGRPVTARELKIALSCLNRYSTPAVGQVSLISSRTASGTETRDFEAMKAFCSILLCTNELVYID